MIRRLIPSYAQLTMALAFAIAGISAPSRAQTPWETSDGSSPIHVVIQTVSEDRIDAVLERVSLREGVEVRTSEKQRLRIPIEDVVFIRTISREDSRASKSPSFSSRRDTTLTLTSGDTIRGEFLDAPEDPTRETELAPESSTLRIETVDLGIVEIDLDRISRIDTGRTTNAAYKDMLRWFNRKDRTEDDQLLLTNGDIVDGLILSIDRRNIAVETLEGDTLVPLRLVIAAKFASTSALPVDARRPLVRLTFQNSGRLALKDFDWSIAEMRGMTQFGRPVKSAADRVIRVDVLGGRWVWLSGHEPISAEHTPMLSLAWEYQNDRNVLGESITVAGERYEKGIGVHSRSVLTYDLKGMYSRFVTSFGMDDRSGVYAAVSVRILVDGQPRFKKEQVVPGEIYGPVRLNIENAGRIELIVDFGKNGDLQDRFNWVETALIR